MAIGCVKCRNLKGSWKAHRRWQCKHVTDIIPPSSTATSMYYRVSIERSYCGIRQHSFNTVPQSIPLDHRAAQSWWGEQGANGSTRREMRVYHVSTLTCQVHVKKPLSEVSLEMLRQAARETTGHGMKGDVGLCVELNVRVHSRLYNGCFCILCVYVSTWVIFMQPRSSREASACTCMCRHWFSLYLLCSNNNNSRGTSFTVTTTTPLSSLSEALFFSSPHMIAINSLQRLLDGRLTTFYIVDTLLTRASCSQLQMRDSW